MGKTEKSIWKSIKDFWLFLRAIPGTIYLSMFFSLGFLPERYGGIAFQFLAGFCVSVYLLRMVRGRMRYPASIVFSVVSVLLVRFTSRVVFDAVVDISARGELLKKGIVFWQALSHYGEKLGQTLCEVLLLIQTLDKANLIPIRTNYLFVLLWIWIIVCLIGVWRKRDA